MAGSGFRGTSSVLMVVAVAAMGGFLYWIYQQSRSLESSVQPVMEDTTGVGGGEGVTLATLARDPASAIGREVLFDSVEVAASLGRAVFTLNVNDTLTYPVLLSSQYIQQGATLYGEDRVTVGGRIYVLNDSIISEWVRQGAVDSTSRGDLPTRASSFLLVDSLDIVSEG